MGSDDRYIQRLTLVVRELHEKASGPRYVRWKVYFRTTNLLPYLTHPIPQQNQLVPLCNSAASFSFLL